MRAYLWSRGPWTTTLVIILVTLRAEYPAAQVLPSEPIQIAGGNVVLGGHVTGTFSVPDDDGFFNYTDYDHNALRMFRMGLTGMATAGDRFAVLGEILTENFDTFQAYALYGRIRPWPETDLDIQVGRIPPTFGAYGRRTYGIGDPFIGYPLSYQYLTTLRPDSLPRSADDLLRQRGLGYFVQYPIGNQERRGGIPLISAFRWDTGIQVHIGRRPVSLTAGVTNGTLSDPRVVDTNAGKQMSGRLELQPTTGLVVGLSVATGPYVGDEALDDLPLSPDRSLRQNTLGFDVEYAKGYVILRVEAVVSSWNLPVVDEPFIDDPVRAYGVSVEGQYKIGPGFFAGARYDYLGFSKIVGTLYDGRPTPWDAPVTRVEVGGGYYLLRNVTAKVAYQHNWRDGGPLAREQGFLATQLSYWF